MWRKQLEARGGRIHFDGAPDLCDLWRKAWGVSRVVAETGAVGARETATRPAERKGAGGLSRGGLVARARPV